MVHGQKADSGEKTSSFTGVFEVPKSAIFQQRSWLSSPMFPFKPRPGMALRWAVRELSALQKPA